MITSTTDLFRDGCAQFNMSPLGFHMWADHYLDWYRKLGALEHKSLVATFLLCRTIELELKAWHRQTTKQTLLRDKFRHDLMASYRALPARHRILSSDEVGLLTRASEIFAKQEFERIAVSRVGAGFKAQLDLTGLETLVKKLMEHGDKLNLAQG